VVGAEADQMQRVLREVGENFRNFRLVAGRESEQRQDLATVPEVVATVPEMETDIHDLAGLLALGTRLWD
jgi:peroxiredoxin